MHIPDGYLSPSTCAALYAAAAPFWAVALRRLQVRLDARFVPLLSLFSAFSFVVMMFNLPLPGGTTGHAVGVGAAAVVLGPSGAILSISVALAIQALLFGDGGITTFGANCFNMAIVGALTAWAIYRAIAGRVALTSRRRWLAAGVAGYAAINVSALCAAVEFGIQPGLFHDAAGTPLYAPYPLEIAMPAMLIGHLTFAGLAEGVLTAGIVGYLQRANASLLAWPAPGPADSAVATAPGGWRATRPLWIGLALALIATPLGLLAAGTAWGEWSLEDFKNPDARQKIAAVSGENSPPVAAPEGLERLAGVWAAPVPDYAPAFLKSRSVGYALSAMFGAGFVVLIWILAGWTVERLRPFERRSP